jgi:glycosyltransferase involved in cell wall biosynthesis
LTISNKLFQYLQAGLAVVATDTAGQREALLGSRAARLVPPDDPLAIAEALEDWLIHPGKLNDAKAAALRLFQQQFCWDRQAEKLLRAANDALTNRQQLAEASCA